MNDDDATECQCQPCARWRRAMSRHLPGGDAETSRPSPADEPPAGPARRFASNVAKAVLGRLKPAHPDVGTSRYISAKDAATIRDMISGPDPDRCASDAKTLLRIQERQSELGGRVMPPDLEEYARAVAEGRWEPERPPEAPGTPPLGESRWGRRGALP